ncbi:MAG: hypothetical protein AAF517_03540 [Planctomycetota bacterium]
MRAFRGVALAVASPDGSLAGEQQLSFPDGFPSHARRFSWLRRGLDHPYEMAAYTLPFLDPVLSKEPSFQSVDPDALSKSGEFLAEILGLGPENLPVPTDKIP